MSRTALTLMVLLVAVLIGSLPGNSLAADAGLQTMTNIVSERIKAQKERRQEIRQQRADARQEVLFWFRTHPLECLLPQAIVDEMVQSGGYWEVAVKWLAGTQNPFFKEYTWPPKIKAFMEKHGVDFGNPPPICAQQSQANKKGERSDEMP